MPSTINVPKKRNNEVVTVKDWNDLFFAINQVLSNKIRLDGDVLDGETQLIFVNGGGIINVRTEQPSDLLGYSDDL